MPSEEGNRAGRGHEQLRPSQRVIHLIRELESLRTFLLANLERQLALPQNTKAIEGRTFLSRFAVELLAENRLMGGGVMFPPELIDGSSLDGNPITIWSGVAPDADIRRLERALARQRYMGEAPFLAWKARGSIAVSEACGWIKELRRNGDGDVRLTALISALEPENDNHAANQGALDRRTTLLQTVDRRLMDLRILTNLPDNTRGESRMRSLAFFDRPAPIYQMANALIDLAWPWSGDTEDCQRLLDGPNSKEFEQDFGRLLAQILGAAEADISESQSNAFGLLVGIAVDQVGRGLAGGDDIHLRKLLIRISQAVVRKREQIIVLSDYGETIRHWLDAGERLHITAHQKSLIQTIESLGFYGLRDWVRSTKNDRAEGVYFLSERKRRDAGPSVDMAKRLPVSFLRASYPVGRQLGRAGGRRFADVTAAEVRLVLDQLHDESPEKRACLLSAFGALTAMRSEPPKNSDELRTPAKGVC